MALIYWNDNERQYYCSVVVEVVMIIIREDRRYA